MGQGIVVEVDGESVGRNTMMYWEESYSRVRQPAETQPRRMMDHDGWYMDGVARRRVC
jgi:hypothetical protein